MTHRACKRVHATSEKRALKMQHVGAILTTRTGVWLIGVNQHFTLDSTIRFCTAAWNTKSEISSEATGGGVGCTVDVGDNSDAGADGNASVLALASVVLLAVAVVVA